MDEKRSHDRIVFETRVAIYNRGKKVASDADTRDISLKGIYVWTLERLKIGTRCGLEIEVTGSSSKLLIHIDGRVVRNDEHGIGLAFESIDLDSYYHLKNILRFSEGSSGSDTASSPTERDSSLEEDVL
jgi:hypothetical protein